ncbi:MAG: metal-dependent hydrolase [Caldilineaceae bacterium]|nr:metal-dependent hydrolase [Caldilineaceae bacterium]
MPVSIRFFGVAAYELITDQGQHILIDPFLDGNPNNPMKADQLEQVDLVLVSHAAFDHLGDTLAIARRTGAPVICGGEVKAYLMAYGLPTEQIRATTWGIAVEVAGVRVQPVECHHWSQITMPDGSYASGQPMGFVIYAAPDVRFYHYGDTAIFSDLKLIAELYAPTIGCIGISQPWQITDQVPGPGRMITGEMSPREGALAARWLGLETVLPCHYIDADNDDVREFERHLAVAAAAGERVPRLVVMNPGDVIEV